MRVSKLFGNTFGNKQRPFVMEVDETARRVNRFKHQSYEQALKSVHLPSALKRTQHDDDIADDASHFHEGLDSWRQLNLSSAFLKFAQKADPLSASMPLLLHNWREIIDLWMQALDVADDDGLRALLDLMQKLIDDIRTTLSSAYYDLLSRLLQLLPSSISPPALTTLLETFSFLFRFLLLPVTDLGTLENTWSSIRSTLVKCSHEVQRAMAEVWGNVLRRLKVPAREKAIKLLAAGVNELEDVTTWVFVFACKSVSQTLHTASPSIILPLVIGYLSSAEPEKLYTLVRRVLTALIHHVQKAEQFTPLSDLLLKQFLEIPKDDTNDEKLESLRRIMDVIIVPAAVRRGSRLTQTQLTTLATELLKLPVIESLYPTLLKLATAILIAGDMTIWMGCGRKIIEKSWQLPEYGIKLCGALIDLEWGGWKMIAVPSLTKMIPQMVKNDQLIVIHLLASLHRQEKLWELDPACRSSLVTYICARLAQWEKGEESVLELHDLLELIPLSPTIPPLVVRIVETTLQCELPREDYENTFANSSWILGACMRSLVACDRDTWLPHVNISSWTRVSIQKWSWSEDVMKGLAALLRACPSEYEADTLVEIYPELRESLLSYSHTLRKSCLQLMSCQSVKSSLDEHQVVERCLQGEEVSLDVQGVRERVLCITKVVQAVKDQSEVGADLCARWLIAQLKVNLRPLWSPAAESLAALSQRFGDIVWALVFDQLRVATTAQQHNVLPQWFNSREDENGSNEDPWEEERSWRDPSAHNLRKTILHWLHNDQWKNCLLEQACKDRFDHQSYEYQLLSTLEKCTSLAEKHNRELIQYFLSLAGSDGPVKMPRAKLRAWLSLFSKFSNPKSLYATETMHTIYLSLLSHPDRPMQKLSLSCLLTYKSPRLTPHEDRLYALLDDTRWRDELVLLDLKDIEEWHRGEFVDVITRLLFGLMLEKRKKLRGGDRRAAILTTLAGCTDQELGLLVDLMLDPLHSNRTSRNEEVFKLHILSDDITEKQQIGFLTLLGEVLKNLGPRLLTFWPVLLGTTLDIVSMSQARLTAAVQFEEEEQNAEEEDADADADDVAPSPKLTRSIRQLGLKRFADFFRCPVQFDFTPFMKEAFSSCITPRLPLLHQENTQAPSALLKLFISWTSRPETLTFLTAFDSEVLPSIYRCLVATNVKPTVISKIFDIVEQILAFATHDTAILETVLKPHISLLLSNLAILVERNKEAASVSSPLGQRQIAILSEIAQYSNDNKQASMLLSLISPWLRKSGKFISENVKVNLLKISSNLLPLIPDVSDSTSTLYAKIYDTLCRAFQNLRGKPARSALLTAFQSLARINPPLLPLFDFLNSLNAYSDKWVDEPDFDIRLKIFATLNETLYTTLSPEDWLPILYNMLHFLQDPTELAVRNNAAFSLRRFVGRVRDNPDRYEPTFSRVLFPELKKALHSRNEASRSEILGVIANAVKECEHVQCLHDMRVLLAGGDDEANFFNNIYHIQIHRRSRALHRLADYCDQGHFNNSTLTEILVPLVNTFITPSLDHHLVNEAISTMGHMARRLAWGQYYALVRQYLKAAMTKDQNERLSVRGLIAILDGFHFPMEEIASEPEQDEGDQESIEHEDGEGHVNDSEIPKPDAAKLGRIIDAVQSRLLPSLLQYLEKHDASTEDSTRIPVASGIVKLAMHLPIAARETEISKLLTALGQILRSHSQETRDLTRDTLKRIAVTLGHSYLPIVIRELRGALSRGPQLHVLAYVVHALLVEVTTGVSKESFQNLDDCVIDVAYVSAEVIFGESGKDVQSENFKTKMREVRASSAKSVDSFAIMAKYISPSKINGLLTPLRAIMQETESAKVMQQVEDLLRRIATGLNANAVMSPVDLLALCHTLISQNARFLKEVPQQKQTRHKGHAIVQMKRQELATSNHLANNSFRFVVFGLDLLHTALRRGRFDLHDSSIVVRLESLVPVVGNTLYSATSPILNSGLKVVAEVIKCPLKSLQKSSPVFVRQIIDIIKQVGSTESELVQTALRSLANILRDYHATQVREKDLTYVLELLSPDLDEPSRQPAVFSMLQAIVSRKFVVPEIYDIMDKVAEIMVTNQSQLVQEQCRKVLLQFLLDYPQGKKRLRNQLSFIAKNLSYEHESGRISVMELLGAIISKFNIEIIREYSDLLFIALVMAIANDDSSKCREMASVLNKSLFLKLDDEHRKVILSHIHAWAGQQSQQLARVSAQIYGLIVDALQADSSLYVPDMLEDLNLAIDRSARQLLAAADGNSMEWQVPYHSMIAISKVLRIFPNLCTKPDTIKWCSIVDHLLFPHAWVRTASCRLLGLLFTEIPISAPGINLPDISPFSNAGMFEITKKLCLQLKSDHLDAALGLQIVKNLFYIGKCFSAVSVPFENDVELVSSPGNADEGEEGGHSPDTHPLPWLFSKLSYQLKSGHIARRNRTTSSKSWSQQPLSILQWFAAMASYLEAQRLEPFLVHILTPVHRITEDDTIRDSQMEELKSLAVELRDLVQSKVGTTKFSAIYSQIRQSTLNIQRERKAARLMQATSDPVAAARRKIRRNTIKKDSRKRKNQSFSDRKGRLKRRREE